MTPVSDAARSPLDLLPRYTNPSAAVDHSELRLMPQRAYAPRAIAPREQGHDAACIPVAPGEEVGHPRACRRARMHAPPRGGCWSADPGSAAARPSFDTVASSTRRSRVRAASVQAGAPPGGRPSAAAPSSSHRGRCDRARARTMSSPSCAVHSAATSRSLAPPARGDRVSVRGGAGSRLPRGRARCHPPRASARRGSPPLPRSASGRTRPGPAPPASAHPGAG